LLGEQIGEARGKRTSRRVLSVDNGFEVEVAFESRGKLVGVEISEVGTYTSQSRSDGTLFGSGQGVIIGADGSLATWKGSGAGKVAPNGSVSYRGAVFYNSASPKFARLNSVAAVFEFEVDPEGGTQTKLWEWK
jgi:hypothetical protein